MSYLGPYARAVYSTKTMKKPVRGCPKCKGSSPYVGKYCGECGTRISTYDVDMVVDSIDVGTLYDELKEVLYTDSEKTYLDDPCYIYLPNVRRDPPREFDPDEVPDYYTDLAEINREAERLWFERAYADEIAILRKHFDSVEIQWGFVQTVV